MKNARFAITTAKIGAGDYRFSASSSAVVFDGYRMIFTEEEEEKEDNGLGVKTLDKDTVLTLDQAESVQHFTQPSPHYTEASLVKALEERGIGRPSTYAPTITTILARRYVVKENKNLYVTELGEAVNQIMVNSFPSIVDERFTANMESLLDKIEEGEVEWKTVIRNFYPDLKEAVDQAEKELEKVTIADGTW